jgi:hypothetical protein
LTAARSAIEAAATARAAVGFAIAAPPAATVARSVNFRDYGGSCVAYASLKIVVDVSSFADRLQSPRVRWTIAVVAILLMFLGFLVLTRRLPKGSLRGAGSEQRVSITAVTREFLLPLAVGFEVVGWRVVWIEGPRNGFIHVVLNRGRDFFRVLIARRQGTTEPVQVSAGPYVLFSMDRERFPGDVTPVMRAMAEHLRTKTNPPPGLGPFSPGR